MPNYDWKKFIKLDENINSEMKEKIIKVLDDMSQDTNGIKILKKAKRVSGEIKITNIDNSEDGSVFKHVIKEINLDSIQINSAVFIDKETGLVFPVTINNIISHELAHAGDKNVKKLTELEKKIDLFTDELLKRKNRDGTAYYNEDETQAKLEKLREDVDNFKSKYLADIENYAVKAANSYAKKFGESERDSYYLHSEDKYNFPDSIAMSGVEKLIDYVKLDHKVDKAYLSKLLNAVTTENTSIIPKLAKETENDCLELLKRNDLPIGFDTSKIPCDGITKSTQNEIESSAIKLNLEAFEKLNKSSFLANVDIEDKKANYNLPQESENNPKITR